MTRTEGGAQRQVFERDRIQHREGEKPPGAEVEQHTEMQRRKKDYLTGQVFTVTGPALFCQSAGAPESSLSASWLCLATVFKFFFNFSFIEV